MLLLPPLALALELFGLEAGIVELVLALLALPSLPSLLALLALLIHAYLKFMRHLDNIYWRNGLSRTLFGRLGSPSKIYSTR